MGMAGITHILREMRGNGDRCCGKTAGMEMGAAGMEFVFAGTPPGRFRNLAEDNNSGASVRLLGIVEYGPFTIYLA